MLKDITLGQFFPGNSFLHRLDPRVKIILAILYIVVVFLCKNIYTFGVIAAFSAFLVLLSGISLKTILKSLKPLIFILSFTTIYNVFFHDGETLLADLGIFEIYFEGIMYALVMAVRIICLLIGTNIILTYTTSPIMLTDSIERLLKPLGKIGLPVHEFAMMMTIALRFIPTLVEETDKIMSAQKARGSDFSSGSLINRAKALVPVLIPLFISSFRRANDLAVAMECRCYRGGSGRTKMTRLKTSFRDYLMLLIIVGLGTGIVFMNIYLPGFVI
ncbi:MAG: energy-coupling factor transporter transmembrane protein EcfT [Clostridia bacterium]|nr:energy-coupling factor transporter transmembrane protein EcfT [Clostridia bacterium]